MKDQKKYADTVMLFNLFRHIISLNQYRFISHTANDVVETLLDFTNLDSSCIYRTDLIKRINNFCEKVDTGIMI